MVFSSHLFVYYFLPACLLAYYLLPRRGRNGALALLSYAFYGWANPLFMGLMLLSTLIDYVCGLLIERSRRGVPPADGDAGAPDPSSPDELPPELRTGRAAVVASIIGNLALLGFFKYFNFGVESWNAAGGDAGPLRRGGSTPCCGSPCRWASASTPSSR